MLSRMKRQCSVDSAVTGIQETNKCRICLKNGEIDLFDDNIILSNVIEFAAITINEHDNLPKYICKACNMLLDSAVLFRKTAKKTDEILRSEKAFKADKSAMSESSEYSSVTRYLQTDKASTTKDSYTEFDEYNNYEESCFDFESEDDDTDNLSTDSESSADIKNEREYLLINNFSEEEVDTNNTSSMETPINDTYMIIVGDNKKQDNIQSDPYICSHCYTSFKTIGELENHSELEHNIKLTDKVNCAVCNEVVSKSFYKVHMKLHKEKYLKNKKQYRKVECKICQKKISKTYYKHHVKIHESDNDRSDRMRDCKICQKSLCVTYYNEHMRRIHKLGPNGEKLHVVNKQKLKHVQCPVCDKKILEENYKIHLAQHGKPPRKYICEHCAREFIHPSAFSTHLLTHRGEFIHKCQFCPYRAKHIALLKVHVRTHTKDYNYKCTECPASFITKSNLNQHLQRHKGPGNIKCYDCNRMFYRKSNMEKHYYTIHLGIKNVLCNICGMGFCHRDNMLSHQIRVHKRDKLLPRLSSYLKAKQEDSETV